MFKKCVLTASIGAVAGLGAVQEASAVSPYDAPYAEQWTWIGSATGSTNPADNAGTVHTGPDGTAWLVTHHQGKGGGVSIWGDAKSGAHFDSGYGHFTGMGNLLFGQSVPNITDRVSENQAYTRTNSGMQGNNFFLGWSANNNAFWDNQSPAQSAGSAPTVFRTMPDGTQDLKKDIQTLTSVRQEGMAFAQNSNVVYYAGGYQSADVVTAGDGAIVGTTNYSPYIGRYDADTETYLGPAKQGNADGRTHYNDVSLDEANNRVYASGYALSNGGTNSFIDVDGDGTADHTFGASTDVDHGFLARFNATTMAYENSIAWFTPEGDDQIRDNHATSDGGVVAVGRTKGNLKTGAANPALGTEDAYVAKYDSSMNLVWDWQSETATFDVAYHVEEDSDGNLYVGVASNNGTDDDVTIMKFDAAGNVVWTKLIDAGGTNEQMGQGRGQQGIGIYDKTRMYASLKHNSTVGPGYTAWTNINPNAGTIDVDNDMTMLQKLVPGDQNADGVVDVSDACAIGLAVHPGSAVDTWDFDEDGDSDPADYIFFVENVLDWTRGDNDLDEDVDTADITDSIINFTGAVGAAGGKCHTDGDTDGDGDVDTADLTESITNFTGALAGNPNVPDLVYDPATGNVTIDADGADVISFSLQSGPFNAADFSELPAGLTDNIASQIGWTSFNLFSGLTGTANLGAILPAGLDQAGLEAALTTASYGLALAGGGGGGRLDLIIPEPASMVLMGLGAVALVRRRRAA